MLRNVLSLLPGWKSTSGIIQLWVHFIPKCPEVFVRLAVSNTASQKACFDFQSDADSVCLICHNDLSQGTGGTTELQCSHSFHKEVTHTHTHRYQWDCVHVLVVVSYQTENAAGPVVCLLSASRSGCGGNSSVLPVTSRCPCHSPSSGAPLVSKSPESQQRQHSGMFQKRKKHCTFKELTFTHLINDINGQKLKQI